MSLERAKNHLKLFGLEHKIMEFAVSSATVKLAAKALGTEENRIAKSLSFKVNDRAILVVCAGDAKIDNKKFKAEFSCKAKMLNRDEVEFMLGHDVGGVCPFGVNEGVAIYLDDSLRRFDSVFPACGSHNSAIELSIDDLEKVSNPVKWVDVCKY